MVYCVCLVWEFVNSSVLSSPIGLRAGFDCISS